MTRRASRAPRVLDFADLRGLRIRSYVRESSPRQAGADHYGPDFQRTGIAQFCDSWQLGRPEREYFETRSARGVSRRTELQASLEEAFEYDVLLFLLTSRSFRNRHDAAIWKRKFRDAGITIVFTQQQIISGHPRHKITEGINEIVDEAYSDSMGEWIGGGLRQKFLKGGVNGVPALGYRRFHGELGDERNGSLIVDESGKRTLRAIVERYVTATYSEAAIAVELNAMLTPSGEPMYTTRLGGPAHEGERRRGAQEPHLSRSHGVAARYAR